VRTARVYVGRDYGPCTRHWELITRDHGRRTSTVFMGGQKMSCTPRVLRPVYTGCKHDTCVRALFVHRDHGPCSRAVITGSVSSTRKHGPCTRSLFRDAVRVVNSGWAKGTMCYIGGTLAPTGEYS